MLNRVIQVLKLLCLDFSEQQKYYEKFVYVPDAILFAIEDDCLVYAEQLYSNKVISEIVYLKFKELENIYSEIIKVEFIDTVFFIKPNYELQKLKEVAKEILAELGEADNKIPDPKYI